MPFDTLSFERRDAVAYVTLNRPTKLNALSLSMVDDLHAAARTIAGDAGVRAVVLTGAGRAFCAGADLTQDEFLQETDAGFGASIGAGLRERFNPMVSAWYALPVPVVVAVNGVAAGAGVSLALLGDIVLAARSATFLQLFAPKLGLMPDLGGTFHLARLVGTARAKGMALLGEALTAADAAQWGLIWACVEDTELSERAQLMARRLAAGPTQAYKRIKQVFNDVGARSLDEQLEREAAGQAELADTADFKAALAAFRHKRAPTFTGD